MDEISPFFNIRKKANSMLGVKWTEEQKKYMVEQRNKKSGYKKGFTVSAETRKKISDGRKGIKISADSIKKGVETRRKNGTYKLTEEHKEKLRTINTGRKHTEETKQKISSARSGSGNGMFGRKKHLHPRYGSKASEETRIKMSKKGKKIIDTNTGFTYENISDFCKTTKIPRGTASKYLAGFVKSVKNFKYHE